MNLLQFSTSHVMCNTHVTMSHVMLQSASNSSSLCHCYLPSLSTWTMDWTHVATTAPLGAHCYSIVKHIKVLSFQSSTSLDRANSLSTCFIGKHSCRQFH